MNGILGWVDTPLGKLPVRIRRTMRSHNAGGSGTLHLFIGVDMPPPGDGGEPLPVEDVA